MSKKRTSSVITPRVNVRMYNHGLGDCFLLTIQGKGNKKAHILIDCGLHGLQAGKRELFEKVLNDIKAHIKKENGGMALDIVVGTHQHYDHLSGFQIVGLNGDAFKDIDIEELWLAWTENEEDQEAKNFQLAQKKKEQAMRLALSRIEKAGFDAAYSEKFKYLLGFVFDEESLADMSSSPLAMAEEPLGARKLDSNEEALKFLRDKVGEDKVRYMEPPAAGFSGKDPGNKPIDIGIEGVRIYVLAPPKHHAEDFLGSMDPRQGEGFGEHDGQAHLFPEEAAFLSALGIDNDGAGGSLIGSAKDYPFSKNYKTFHNPFTHNYLLSQKLQLALKNNMAHLLKKLLCSEIERLGKAPTKEDTLQEIVKIKLEEHPAAEVINQGLEHFFLTKLKATLQKLWDNVPEDTYSINDYEPEELRTPYLEDGTLDEIFEIQLKNYLYSMAPWAADFFGENSEKGKIYTYKDILTALFASWLEKAMKGLVEEVFMEFQHQQEGFTTAFKKYVLEDLDKEERAELERLFPTEEDKNDFMAFLMKSEVSILKILAHGDAGLEELIFNTESKYLSSIEIRKRIKEAVDNKVVTDRSLGWMKQDKLKDMEGVKNLALKTTQQGLELKLKELAKELKGQKREKGSSVSEDNFLSEQDKTVLLKHLAEGLPTDLLEGLSPLDRIVLEYGSPSGEWRKIDQDWLRTAEAMALKLDSVRNNTSLVLAIELVAANKVLLFPGDAQAGNWRSWAEVEYEVEGQKVKAEELLKKTVFYKVGHHGSHNATLKNGLDLMKNKGLAAMIPVDQDVADKVGWEMPFAPLLEALLEKTGGKVAIADNKMDIGRLLKQLPKEHRTKQLEERLEQLKAKWEKGRKAFTPSKEMLDDAGDRPLYFEYTVS